MNFAKTKSFTVARGVCQFSIRAFDATPKNKPDLTLAEKIDLLGMLDNKTSDLPGVLPLVMDMPLVIKPTSLQNWVYAMAQWHSCHGLC